MKLQILIFFVCVSCFNIVSSYRRHQEFEHDSYRQHSDLPIHQNDFRNIRPRGVYPVNSESVKHPEPQYVKDPQVYENIAEASAESQSKSRYEEHKPPVYIAQPYQEPQRTYPVEKTFDFHVPRADNIYRPVYTQHIAKPQESQKTYPPSVHQWPYYQPPAHQKPYYQPMVYNEHQSSVPQPSPPLQHAQFQRPQHQQTYYKSQVINEVPISHVQAHVYAPSETNVADILESEPEIKDYLESALLKHYQNNDLGNSHHVKSNDVKLEENNNDIGNTEKPPNNPNNNEYFPYQPLDNNDDQNKKIHVPQKNKHIVNPQTIPEETKHEITSSTNDYSEKKSHPRFSYLNYKDNPAEVKTFPIEVKLENVHYYRESDLNHDPNAKSPDHIPVDEKQKPAVPFPSIGDTDHSYPIEPHQLKNNREQKPVMPPISLDNKNDIYLIGPQHSKIDGSSTLKHTDVAINDHVSPTHEQLSKEQSEPMPYAGEASPENNKFPSHNQTEQIFIDKPVDEFIDTPSHGNNKSKHSFDDVTPQLLHSDIIDETKAPQIESPNSVDEDTNKELYSNPQAQPEVTNHTEFQKEDSKKSIVNEINQNKNDYKQQTINEEASDYSNKQQKAESETKSMISEDNAKSIEESSLNADSPTDDGTSTEEEHLQNDDATSGETDPNNNADDEEAADSENDVNEVLLRSIDFWEKLSDKQPNMELLAFNVVTTSPIVQKTSRFFVFPNHTTVEETVETIWKHEGDSLPLGIIFNKTIIHPNPACCRC